MVRVEKVVAVADAGKIINPMTSESQVRGVTRVFLCTLRAQGHGPPRSHAQRRSENRKILGAQIAYRVVLLDVYNGKSNTR